MDLEPDTVESSMNCFPIFFRESDGSETEVQINAGLTVGAVIEKVYPLCSTDVSLIYKGKLLSPESTLLENKIGPGFILHVLRSLNNEDNENFTEICIRFKNTIYKIGIDPAEGLKGLQKKIQSATKVSVKRQKIVHEQMSIESEIDFKSFPIVKGTHLTL